MEDKNRRNFLKSAALIGGATLGLAATDLKAQHENAISEDRMGVLVDTTVCIGCRNCEFACKSAHDIPTKDVETYHNREVFKEFRRPVNDSLTVVNEFKNPKNELVPINVKYQCMHCDKPACVSACIVGAFQKHANGAVTWDGSKCIGCRYCMVACPFQIPTFEFKKAIQPDIHKCDFCFNRTKEGKLPACVEICPVEAITYGQRSELIRTARKRIQRYPERYKNYIYGENEVGGTSWMYLSSMDFQYLQLPKQKNYPAPGVSESIQHGIFAYFIPPIALYAWLGGIMWVSKRRAKLEEEIGEKE